MILLLMATNLPEKNPPLIPTNLFRYLLDNAKGRANAKHSATLEERFDCSGRKLRTAINKMETRFDVVVLATNTAHGGYYLPTNEAEIEAGLQEMLKHLLSEEDHYQRKAERGHAMLFNGEGE